MTRRTRFLLKFLAIVLVLLAVLMELGTIHISGLYAYKFWMSILGFGILLASSR